MVRPWSLRGAQHFFGPDQLVELLGREQIQRDRGLLERRALGMRLLGDLGGVVVADLAG